MSLVDILRFNLGNDLFRFANFVVEAVKGAGSTKPTTHWKAWAFSGISFCMITRIRPAAQTPAERAASANGSITALHRRRRRSGSLAMLAAMRSASSRGRLRPHLLEFIFLRAHNSSEFGGVPMPLTGAIPEGRSFFCPHCGALYAVTYLRLSNSDSNFARCVVCGQIMDKWDSTKVPIFKLIHRPEDY
jgi:hypothetical protein